jgi:hypothetical protein
MADVTADFCSGEKYYCDLYKTITAKAMARSAALILGVLIATAPHVLACFSCVSFLFVFPYWAMTLIFIGAGGACAIGIYFLLKFFLVPTANHRNEHEASPLSLQANGPTVNVADVPLTANIDEEDDSSHSMKIVLGESARETAVTSVFLSGSTLKIYLSNEVQVLHIFGPLTINEEFMKNLHIYDHGTYMDNQFYNGMFCMSNAVVESFPHMLDKIYSETRVLHDTHTQIESQIKYHHCDFRDVDVLNATSRAFENYFFYECTITPNVLKFIKDCSIGINGYFGINKMVSFEHCNFAGNANEIDTELRKVNFVGQGEILNKFILNILKHPFYRATFTNYQITEDILGIDLQDDSSPKFLFKNCILSEGVARQIAHKSRDRLGHCPLSWRKMKPALLCYENMKIDDKFLAELGGEYVVIHIKNCTFDFNQDPNVNRDNLCFFYVKIAECEISNEVFKLFTGANTTIGFYSCVFHSSITPNASTRCSEISINACDGGEYVANALKEFATYYGDNKNFLVVMNFRYH